LIPNFPYCSIQLNIIMIIMLKILIPLSSLFVLSGCIQNSYISTGKDIKTASVLIIMPEQKCNKENMGRILTGEKVLHPAHKECYYE